MMSRHKESQEDPVHRWMLVDDFVKMFNVSREKNFSPSSFLWGDESMIRWYGLCGRWINTIWINTIGIPMFVAMDKKPEDRCEI